MVNVISDTPILTDSYNSHGLITHNFATRNCVRTANGDLWTVIADQSGTVHLMKSDDNGYSWGIVRAGIQLALNMRENAGLLVQGMILSLAIDERNDILEVGQGTYDGISDYDLYRGRYVFSEITTDIVYGTSPTIADSTYEGVMDMCHNYNQIYYTYILNSNKKLQVKRASPRSTSLSAALELNLASIMPFFNTCCDGDGNVDICFVQNDTGNAKYLLKHVRYTTLTPAYGSVHTILDIGDHATVPVDVVVARDGDGTLCCFWGETGGGTCVSSYSISEDSGATWSVPEALTPTAGHLPYYDAISTDTVMRNNIIGSAQGGFLLGYTELVGSLPRTFVRQLTWDGDSWELGDELEIGTSNQLATDAIVGMRFFHPTDVKLMDLSDPGVARVAYQVGEGNVDTMNDTVPVNFCQELLRASAFPTEDALGNSVDTLTSGSLLVTAFVTGPQDNIDFYAAGITGRYTSRYVAAFEKGTSIRLLKYEPKQDNWLDDQTAYGDPVEYYSKAFFDPLTYSFPLPDVAIGTTDQFMERDVRKIYLPPDFHLSRTFQVNKGGYLKRTVWTCEFDGNAYEISQVVPRFISNEICFWEANAYVIGPSRDPFRRTVLPSET